MSPSHYRTSSPDVCLNTLRPKRPDSSQLHGKGHCKSNKHDRPLPLESGPPPSPRPTPLTWKTNTNACLGWPSRARLASELLAQREGGVGGGSDGPRVCSSPLVSHFRAQFILRWQLTAPPNTISSWDDVASQCSFTHRSCPVGQLAITLPPRRPLKPHGPTRATLS